jgi:hypothetical protein
MARTEVSQAESPESTAATQVAKEAGRGAINFGRLRRMMLARCLDQRSLAALAGICLALARTPVDPLAQELTG